MIKIYKASAGSGKTFTLAREYIKLILGHKDSEGRYVLNSPSRAATSHRPVLAMTFTNKATEEMKSRIIHELAVLAGFERGWDEKSPYEKDLCKEFNCSPQELAAAAGGALRALLYDFSRFSVSTIDSFFQAVLRSFAHEADVSGNYGLELDDEEVITMSVDEMLQSLNHDKPSERSKRLEHWITGYMKSLIDEGSQFTLFNRGGGVQQGLVKFISRIHNDTFRENEQLIMDYLHDPERFDRFRKQIYELHGKLLSENSVKTAATNALGSINQLQDSDKLVQKKVINLLEKIVKDGINGFIKSGLPATALKISEDPSSLWKVDAIRNGMTSPLVEGLCQEAIEVLECNYRRVVLLNIIRANIYRLGLLSSVMELMDRYRIENSTLLLSDTNSLLSKIIDGEDSPFLYEKLGTRFNHFLIDEFQDTSHSQWSNMRPLLKESLAYGHDNLVIGDEKQCIYRFRNSDPSLLHNLHAEPWADGRCETRGENADENTNWRSSAEVVRFNNALFSAIARQQNLSDVYSGVVQNVSPKHLKHKGYVDVRFFGPNNADPMRDALEKLGVDVRRQLESGYLPGDIAILVRTAGDGNRVIHYFDELHLEDETYPSFDIISDKSLLISSSHAVKSIISRLRLMSSVDITPERHRRTNTEIALIIDRFRQLHSAGSSPETALGEAVRQVNDNSVEGTSTGAQLYKPLSIHGIDLVSVIENIISELPYEMRADDNVHISAFMDMVIKYMGRGHADIRSFLKWWDDSGCTVSISGGKDTNDINILTVHKSKGLEFPCVHVPFAEFSTNNSFETSWFRIPAIEGIDPEIIPPMMPLNVSSAFAFTPFAGQLDEIKRDRVLDRTNLLYVAFTRAVDELCISVKVSKQDSEGTTRADAVPSSAAILFQAMKSGQTDGHVRLSLDKDMRFTIGEPTCKHTVKAQKGNAMHPDEAESMAPYELTSSESVWGNTNVELPDSNRIGVARERGVILHNIMSMINHPEDIENAFRQFATTADAAELNDYETVMLRNIISTRVNDPRVSRWFVDYRKAYTEREIITSKGLLRRMDRVVHTSDGELHVIDYKSGSQDPKKYMRKIREYMDFFRSTGYPAVQGFLYYLDSGRIVEVE